MRARPPRLLPACLVGLGVLALSGVARAQPAPVPTGVPVPTSAPIPQAGSEAAAPPAPVITKPVLKRNDGAVYPKQALDDGVVDAVEVPLVLDIGVDGDRHPRRRREAGRATASTRRRSPRLRSSSSSPRRGTASPSPRGSASSTGSRRRLRGSPGASSRWRVRDRSSGRPWSCADATGAERTATTDAAGAWRIDGLPAGTYHLIVSASGMVPHEADEPLKPGEEASAIDRLAPEAAPAAPASAAARGGARGRGQGHKAAPRGDQAHASTSARSTASRARTATPFARLQNLPGVGRPPGFAGLLIVRGSAPARHAVLRRRHARAPRLPLRRALLGRAHRDARQDRLLSRATSAPSTGARWAASSTSGCASPKADKLHAMAEATSSTRASSCRGPSSTPGGRSRSRGGARGSTCGSGPCSMRLDAGVSVAPVYYDYQAMLERDLSKHETFRSRRSSARTIALAILLRAANASEPELAGSSGRTPGFWRIQALYKNQLTDEHRAAVIVAVGQDYVTFNGGSLFSFDLTDYARSRRASSSRRSSTAALTMNVGFDVIYAPYTISAVLPATSQARAAPARSLLGPASLTTQRVVDVLRAGVLHRVGGDSLERHAHRAGRPARLHEGHQGVGPQPRASSSVRTWRRDPRTTLKAGARPLHPAAAAAGDQRGLRHERVSRATARTTTTSASSTSSPSNIEASVDGFYKQLDHLVVQGLGNTGSGAVYGAEALIRYKPDERFFGWLVVHALAQRAPRRARDAAAALRSSTRRTSSRSSGATASAAGWEFGAAFRLISGYMYTPENYGFYDENIGDVPPAAGVPAVRIAPAALPDARPARRQDVEAALGVVRRLPRRAQHRTTTRNVDGVTYDYNLTHNTWANDIPFLPSLGARLDM